MKVSVKLLSSVKTTESITLKLDENATVEILLMSLKENKEFKTLDSNESIIIINKKRGSLETILHDGDSVLILQPIAGG